MNYRKESMFYILLTLGLSMIFIIVLGAFELGNRRLWESKISVIDDIDHRLKPNIEGNNSDGIRCNKEPDAFAPEHLNIIFLGDSFVYGQTLPTDYIFVQRFERMANAYCNPELTVNVANFGWTSSSPYLSLRLLKDIGSKYNPDIVFLCVDMTDFHDDLKYQSLIERPKIIFKMIAWLPGTVLTLQNVLYRLTRHNPSEKLYEIIFGFPNDHFFIVNKPLNQTRKYCKNIVSNINKINDYVTMTLKAKFILIILPRSFQYSSLECPDNWEADQYEVFGPYVYEPFKLFKELKEKVNYPIYSMLNVFKYSKAFPTCYRNDPHWNARGHTVAALSIFEIAKRKNIFSHAMSDKISTADLKNTGSRGIGNASKPSSLTYQWLEAEDSDTIITPLEVAYDEHASEDRYVYSPDGLGNQYSPCSIMARYSVRVSQTGYYVLWGRVQARDEQSDSFFVQVDDGLDNLWEVARGDNWHWDLVNNWDIADDPVLFFLDEGSHMIKIKLREDGTKIDKMLLTNDLRFLPRNEGEIPEKTGYSKDN